MKLFIGFVGSLLIAIVAYRKRSLSASGAVAVVIIGTLIYALSDIKWYGVLLAFFISSSLLSHRKKEAKQEVESLFAKTGTRDFMQVFANGGAGLVAILGAFIAAMEEGWYAFYIGSIAAVTADTWATEIGVLAKGKPRHIFTWRKVDPGTSGGVSGAGLAASFAGGTFIGGCACLFSLLAQEGVNVHYVVAGAVGGMIGSLIDSAVGAAWQRMYRCQICGKETERKLHCGRDTIAVKGYAWCTNDAVNALASIAGGLTALIITG